MANLFPKRCKVYPRNNMQFISGILKNQKRIELPAELPLSEKELRRCLSYGNCFEMVNGKHVLLTLDNFNKDNKDGKDVTATLPEDEVSKPRDEEDEGTDEDVEEDGPVAVAAHVEERKVEPTQAATQVQPEKPQNNQQGSNNQQKNQKNDPKQQQGK